jgi:hypothetical protein
MKPATFSIFVASLVVLCLQPCARAVTVNVDTWDDPNTTTFDPCSPPEDLDGEDGDAKAVVEVKATVDVTESEKKLIVNKIVVEAKGHTEIRLPTNADPNLEAHEKGHDKVHGDKWNEAAKKDVEAAFKEMDQKKYEIETGKTVEETKAEIEAEVEAAEKQAKEAIEKEMEEAKKRYDANDVTDHGKKKESEKEEEKKKVEEERKEAEKKKEAMDNKEKPSDEEEAKKVEGTAETKQKEEQEQKKETITFDPNTFAVTVAADPGDPINGRVAVQMGDITPLGKDATGVVACADSHVKLLDTGGGGWFFEANLYSVRILPSTLPQYSQMIQGVLNVWEVNNTIGSGFLSQVQQGKEEEEYLSFWFYADEPMVDENGKWVASGNVTGQAILGLAVRADVAMSEDFEKYDPYSFMSAWAAAGYGTCMLEEEEAYSGAKCMRLMVNNVTPDSYSAATHLYPVVQDFSGTGKTLDVYLLREYPQPPENDFYVTLQDYSSHSSTFSVKTAGQSQYTHIMSNANQWMGISIDTRVFAAPLDLSHIQRITVGFHSTMPTAGPVLIDAISIHEKRLLGSPVGDFNGDSRVTMTDFAIFASHWLEEEHWPL